VRFTEDLQKIIDYHSVQESTKYFLNFWYDYI